MRQVTVGIECDATGLGTGPVDHDDIDAEGIIDAEELVDAPHGWLAVSVVRVVPNPKAGQTADIPPMPTEESEVAAWAAQMQDFAQQVPEPANLVQTALFYLSPDAAHSLDKIMPGCWRDLDDFADLAAKALQ